MKPLELIVLVVVVGADLALAGSVYFRNPRARNNRLFGATALLMSVYLIGNFMCDQPAFYGQALLLNRLTMAAGCVLTLALFLFVGRFSSKMNRLAPEWWVLTAVLGGAALASAATNWVIAGVEIRSWGTNVVQGWMFPFIVYMALALCIVLAVSLAIKYRVAEPRYRVQYAYLFLGLGMFMVTSVLLAVVLPGLTGANQLAQFEPLASMLFLGPAGYAIVRHRLMDVRVVALRAAVYAALLTVAGLLLVVPTVLARTDLARQLGIDVDIVYIVAGLGAVLAYQPLKQLLDRASDRIFYQRTYDPDALLRDLGHAMAETLDVDELASRISERMGTRMKLAFAAVAYFRSEIPLMAATGPAPSEGSLRQLLSLARAGKTLFADELESDSEELHVLSDAGARVLAPLLSDGDLIGAVILGPKRSGQLFSAIDTRFIEIMRSEASIAMKNGHLFDEKNQRVRELTALNDLAYALGADIELESVLDSAMGEVVNVTSADSGTIMLLDPSDLTLSIAASRGVDANVVANTKVTMGEGIAGWVAKSREPVILVGDIDPRFEAELHRDHIVSAISAPVICKDSVIGVINVNRVESTDLFTRENLNMVMSFAGQMAVVIENARLYRELENTILGTIEALAAAVDAKDTYTAGHSKDVTDYAVAIARKLGLPEEVMRTLYIAATLHDIGKIGIDGSILNKPGRLTDEEFAEMRRHPTIGADILSSLQFLDNAVPLILFHHERYDGGGYPSGISGETIPLGARIIAVADSFNAMTSSRVYRGALPFATAIDELLRCSGSQFDPDAVDAFLEVLAEEQAVAVRKDSVLE